MREVNLLQSTGSPAIDRIVKGIIGFCELLFPDRIRGYYLQGSYARGDATEASDIDLLFVFKDDFAGEDEKQRARCVDPFSEWLVGRQLDITPTTELELASKQLVDATALMQFKYGAVLLFGKDIRDAIQPPSHLVYSRACLHHALRAISWHHHHPKALRYPLNYPDKDAEFYGFNQYMYTVDEHINVGTERLIYSLVRSAGALLSLKTEKLFFSKRSCVNGYRQVVGDSWAAFVSEVFYLCHDAWHCLIPTGEAERRRLRRFYGRALDFENYFLSTYQTLLLEDLDPPMSSFAKQRSSGLRSHFSS